MTMELWGLSGGSPKLAQGQFTVGGAAQDTTLITVAAGKRVVPVWLSIWGLSLDADRITTFVVRSASTLKTGRTNVLLDNAKSLAVYMQPMIFRFGLTERNTFDSGENLKATLTSTDTTTADDLYYYALGYYLVDA